MKYELTQDRNSLVEMGLNIEFVNYTGRDNYIDIDKESIPRIRMIKFTGEGSGNLVRIEGRMPGTTISPHLRFHGKDALVNIAGSSHPHHSNFVFVCWGQGSQISIGQDTTCNSAVLEVLGSGNHIRIGEDCMIANNVWIRNYDMHAIIDLEIGMQVNHPGNVDIGDHVWLGQDVLVLGDARIGQGSIIGARSLARGDIGECVIAAGVPAKILKEKATWHRAPVTTTNQIKELKRTFLGNPVNPDDSGTIEK